MNINLYLVLVIAFSPVQKTIAAESLGDPNIPLFSYLDGVKLSFERLEVGAELPMNTLIVLPAAVGGRDGEVTLSFDRSTLSDAFVRDFFFNGNKLVRDQHSFSHMQMEAILTNKKLILRIHDGIILHVRSDTQFPGGYTTFKDDGAKAKVVDVKGHVLYSIDREIIKSRLGGLFVLWTVMGGIRLEDKTLELPDGRILGWTPLRKNEFPKKYEPRVEAEGGEEIGK
jgi:hypothetical protein